MINEAEIKIIEKHIGKQLREKRRKRGFTLSFVASKIGRSYQQVQKYEQAKTTLSAALLYKLANVYDVGIEKFFDDMKADKEEETYETDCIINNQPREHINILLAEDNPGDEVIVRKALESFSGLNILCVHDGNQVMEVVRYRTLCPNFPRPDLILLDVILPKRDGLSVLREIKRDREIQEIPVVILTNSVNSEMMMNAYKIGASGYICKSFDYNTFKDNISNCITYWSKVVILPTLKKIETLSKNKGIAS